MVSDCVTPTVFTAFFFRTFDMELPMAIDKIADSNLVKQNSHLKVFSYHENEVVFP